MKDLTALQDITRLKVTLLTLPLVLIGCQPHTTAERYQGYVEGEFLYLASPQAGYLEQVQAARGSRVETGQPIFSIATDPDRQSLSQAEAQASAAQTRVENLKAPRRAPEIAALEAQLDAAKASLHLSELHLARQQRLAADKFIAQAQVDEARSARDRDAAQVASLQQQIATYQSSLGRQAEVSGAESDLRAAQALVEQRRWQVAHKSITAPAGGEIAETYYRPGEWVAAGSPVASLLPDDRRRLRFFVPEVVVAKLAPGQRVTAYCDGCDSPIQARIDFVAPEAEYTPPVIYSQGRREKLVFRVEAVPEDPAARQRLHPGLPVDIQLADK